MIRKIIKNCSIKIISISQTNKNNFDCTYNIINFDNEIKMKIKIKLIF